MTIGIMAANNTLANYRLRSRCKNCLKIWTATQFTKIQKGFARKFVVANICNKFDAIFFGSTIEQIEQTNLHTVHPGNWPKFPYQLLTTCGTNRCHLC